MLEFHEVADIFPLLEGDEFQSLKDDISTNGLIDPIWTYQEKIIDGRNRYRACTELGIDSKFREWDGKGSLVSFVISLNLHRRHLDSSQRAAASVSALPLLDAEANERMLAGVNPTQKIGEGSHAGESAEQAAKLFGTNRQYVSDAKKILQEAPELFEKIRVGEMTIPEAKKKIRRDRRVEELAEISKSNTPLDGSLGKFHIIYADPPWEYEYSKSDSRAVENHYPTMELADIMSMPVQDTIAENDCVLLMWATSPKLSDAMKVLEAWGFQYRTCMVWVKDKIGMGYYARQRHEILLIATRGSLPVPESQNRPDSVVESPRTDHSKKPNTFYEIIEKMYPEYTKLELFGREKREGWQSWGNQVS